MASKLQLNTTLKPEWREMFDEIERATGLTDQHVVKAVLHALHEYWQTHKEFRVPALLVAAQSDEGQLVQMARATPDSRLAQWMKDDLAAITREKTNRATRK